MSTTRKLVAVATIVLAAFAGAAVPAGAQGEVQCRWEIDIALAPGLSVEPSSGVFHSGGETGPITCGDRTGKIGNDGRYGTAGPVTCTSGGEGWGVLSYTFPDGNTKDTFTVKFGALSQGQMSATFEGEHLSGRVTFTPTEGDCVTAPVTRGRLDGEGVYRP